jgi:hypothetical protein
MILRIFERLKDTNISPLTPLRKANLTRFDLEDWFRALALNLRIIIAKIAIEKHVFCKSK